MKTVKLPQGWKETTEEDAGRVLPHYVLRLYVTGTTPRASRAIMNIREICEQYLHGRYELEIVDIYQQKTLAEGEQIIAAPTLIKQLPLPLRRFIGDMTDKERLLIGLDLISKSKKQKAAADPGPADS